MPRPEPLPSFPNFITHNPDECIIFRSINEINGAVTNIIQGVSRSGNYTGVGRIQDELFRCFPNSLPFIQRLRLHPDNIPAIVEHKRLIQRANSLLWAYASTHNVTTLSDLDSLLTAEFRDQATLLGPIFNLPVAQDVCEVDCFHPRVQLEFTEKNAESIFCLTTDRLMQELNHCVCKNRFRLNSTVQRHTNRWWESVFTRHMLCLFEDTSVMHQSHNSRTETLEFLQLNAYGIRIKGFSKMIESITEMLRPESLARAARLTQEMLDTEVRRIYEKFADDVVSDAAIARLRKQKPMKALRVLANNCRNLHDQLTDWSAERNLSWSPGFLDALISFEKFLSGIANTGPMRSLLHMVLLYSKTSSLILPDLISRVREAIVIDVDESVDKQGSNEGSSLMKIVERFNTFLDSHRSATGSAETESRQFEQFRGAIPWSALRDFEQELQIAADCKRKSLIGLLADASENQSLGNPQCLFVESTYIKGSESVKVPKQIKTANTSAEQEDHLEELIVDLQSLRNFLLRLTCVTERTTNVLKDLAVCHLKIPDTDDLVHNIGCVLSEIIGQYSGVFRMPYLNHPLQFTFLGSSNNASNDHLALAVSFETINSRFINDLFTQRTAALDFLAACPPLRDPEEWTLWSYPGFLSDRWGSLEEFLDDCQPLEVCDKFNLVVIKLSTGGFVRLSANATLNDLHQSFHAWVETQTNPYAIQSLCDLLIGSALAINRLLPNESVPILANGFKCLPDNFMWISLVLHVLLCVPLSLLGVVFSKILVPSLHKAGVCDKTAWSHDLCNLTICQSPSNRSEGARFVGLLSVLSHLEGSKKFSDVSSGIATSKPGYLVSAIGAVGAQLAWPAWLDFYRQRRFRVPQKSSDAGDLHSSVSALNSFDDEKLVPLIPSQKDSLSLNAVAPVASDQCGADVDGLTNVVTKASNFSSRREFVNHLRKTEFGCGVQLDESASLILQRYKGRLSRSLAHLSEELYGQPGHFLLEFVQNADDNDYVVGTDPSIEFHLLSCENGQTTLFVRNNESIGFSEADMAALCDVGLSTKLEQRDEKIGRKGIGFKSVFSVTDLPEVHSSGFHVRFERRSSESHQQGCLLMPEWVDDALSPLPIADLAPGGRIQLCSGTMQSRDTWKTVFKLPLSGRHPTSTPTGVYNLATNLLTPMLVLFLRRLTTVVFSYASIKGDGSATMVAYKRFSRISEHLPTSHNPEISKMELLTVVETHLCDVGGDSVGQTNDRTHEWIVFSHYCDVNADFFNLSSSKMLSKRTKISIAIDLEDSFTVSDCPIFAFLPIRSAGFSFLLNADFDLTSSREDVDGSSVWNQWLVSQLPRVFEVMLKSLIEAPESCRQALNHRSISIKWLIAKVLDCLPIGSSMGSKLARGDRRVKPGSFLGIFSFVGEQLRDRLSRFPWIPVKPDALCSSGFASPQSSLLLKKCIREPDKTNSSTCDNYTKSIDFLIRLLVDRLGLREIDEDFLLVWNRSGSLEADPKFVDEVAPLLEHRMVQLLTLGAQNVSADSLLELAANLSADELRKPGVLLALLGNIEASLTSSDAVLMKHRSIGMRMVSPVRQRRRCATALHHLAIFPLSDGRLVSLGDLEIERQRPTSDRISCLSSLSPLFIPPAPFSLLKETNVEVYAAFISLLSRLGPVIAPSALYPTMQPVDLPVLLTNSLDQDGLGISVANPEVVLQTLIMPRLTALRDLRLQQVDPWQDTDWFIAATQFAVWCSHNAASQGESLFPICQKADNASCVGDFVSILAPDLPIVCCHEGIVELQSSGLLTKEDSFVEAPLSSLPGLLRTNPVFIQPFLLKCGSTSDSALEHDLMSLCMSKEGADATKTNFISANYFINSQLLAFKLTSSDFFPHWVDFTLKAGASTLMSLHTARYFYAEDRSCLPQPALPLDSHFIVQLKQLSTKLPMSVCANGAPLVLIVEDAVCSGLDYILGWIQHNSSGSNHELSFTASQKLTALLNFNWPKFDGAKLAVAYQQDDSRRRLFGFQNQRTTLADSTWLRRLRRAKWLLVSSPDEVNFTHFNVDRDATTSGLPVLNYVFQSAFAADTNHATGHSLLSNIYAPTAFNQIDVSHDTSNQVLTLLAKVSPVWYPGAFCDSPLHSGLIDALGLRIRLDKSAFKYVFKWLTTFTSVFAPSIMTPAFMIKIYQFVEQLSTPHLTAFYTDENRTAENWLKCLLAPPAERTILVSCTDTNTGVGGKKNKPASSDNVEASPELCGQSCAICSRIMEFFPVDQQATHISSHCKRVMESMGGKNASTPRYHLVPITWTCWQQVALPKIEDLNRRCLELELELMADDEDGEDFLGNEPIPNTSAGGDTPFILNFNYQRIPLCDTYASESRHFFCNILKAPATSALEEVLLLRPSPPKLSSGSHNRHFYRLQKQFGLCLGAWYALIDFSFMSELEVDPTSRSALMSILLDFPLLYDMSGHWRTPKSTLGTLFAWSSSDLVDIFVSRATGDSDCRSVLLGYSLKTMGASASSPTHVAFESACEYRNPGTMVGTSNAFLLDVLNLPVFDKVAEVTVGLFEVPTQSGSIAGFSVPCLRLDAVVNSFRNLAKVWLSSTHRALQERSSSLFLASKTSNGVEVYLVPNLNLLVTLILNDARQKSSKWVLPCIACRFVNGKFYVDSQLGEKIFSSSLSSASFIHSFHFALSHTENGQQVLLQELAKAAFPSCRSIQLGFLQFVQGLLNVITPLLDRTETLQGRNQLSAYMLSHGFSKSQTQTIITVLFPDTPSSTAVHDERSLLAVSGTASASCTPSTSSDSHNKGFPDCGGRKSEVEGTVLESLPSSLWPIRRSETVVPSQGTRYQTIFSDAFSGIAPPSHLLSIRTPEERTMVSTSASAFWNSVFADSSPSTTHILGRLERLLSSETNELSTFSGRHGEMTVYHILREAVHSQEVGGCQSVLFPTGHPKLGAGRLVDCRWVNADAESRLPYDITVTLQVECDHTQWHSVVNGLSREIAQNIVRIDRTPSSNCCPGYLTVGPIFIEVKSTIASNRVSHSLDLFEISLTEAVYAKEVDWRYHLIRVHWSRECRHTRCHPSGDLGIPRLTHVPNLSDALCNVSSSGLRMCVAISDVTENK